MLTHNGNQDQSQTNEALTASLFTPKNLAFLETIHNHGPDSLCESIKMIHDLLLYYSDVIIDQPEKAALFDLKVLGDALEGM